MRPRSVGPTSTIAARGASAVVSAAPTRLVNPGAGAGAKAPQPAPAPAPKANQAVEDSYDAFMEEMKSLGAF